MRPYPLSKKPLTPRIAREVGISFLHLCRYWSIVCPSVDEPTWVNKPAPLVKPRGSWTKDMRRSETQKGLIGSGKAIRGGLSMSKIRMKLQDTTTVSKEWAYVCSTGTVAREISSCFSSHPLPQGAENVPRAAGWCVFSLFLECNRYEVETGGCHKLLEFIRPVILIPLFPTCMIKEEVSATTRRTLCSRHRAAGAECRSASVFQMRRVCCAEEI